MDLEKMIESETPDSLKIAELIEERSQINDYKNELETRRKEIDKELDSIDIPNSAGPEFPNINDYLYKVQ